MSRQVNVKKGRQGFQPTMKGKRLPTVQKQATKNMPPNMTPTPVKTVTVEQGTNTKVVANSIGAVYRDNYDPRTNRYTQHHFGFIRKLLWRIKIKKAFQAEKEREHKDTLYESFNRSW